MEKSHGNIMGHRFRTANFQPIRDGLEIKDRGKTAKEAYERIRATPECRNGFCIEKRDHAIKNPTVIATIIKRAQENGKTSPTLKSIIEEIIAQKQ